MFSHLNSLRLWQGPVPAATRSNATLWKPQDCSASMIPVRQQMTHKVCLFCGELHKGWTFQRFIKSRYDESETGIHWHCEDFPLKGRENERRLIKGWRLYRCYPPSRPQINAYLWVLQLDSSPLSFRLIIQCTRGEQFPTMKKKNSPPSPGSHTPPREITSPDLKSGFHHAGCKWSTCFLSLSRDYIKCEVMIPSVLHFNDVITAYEHN